MENWVEQKMPRPLQLLVQGESGLLDGTAVWIDGEWLHALLPQSLTNGQAVRGRLDLGAQGSQVDLQLTPTEIVRGRETPFRRGYLHRTRWLAVELEAGDELMGLLPLINPRSGLGTAPSSVSRTRSEVRARSDVQSRSDSLTSPSRVDRSASRRSGRRRRSTSGSDAPRRSPRWRSIPATLDSSQPPFLLVEVTDVAVLQRALRFGPTAFRLATKLPEERAVSGQVVLVVRLPDGA